MELYYPFGLGMKGLDWTLLANSKENQFQFNGIEKNKDFDLNTFDAFYRTGDPQIGRWWQVDPKPTYGESPYTMMRNNPMRYADPLGDTVRFQGNKQSIIAMGKIIDFLSSVSKDFKNLYSSLEKSSNTHRIYLKDNSAFGSQNRKDYLQKANNKQIGTNERAQMNNPSNQVFSNSFANSSLGKGYDGNDINGKGTGSTIYLGLDYAIAKGEFFPQKQGTGAMHYLATIAHEFYHARRNDKGNAGARGAETDKEESDATDFQNVVTRDINSFLHLLPIPFSLQIPYRAGYRGGEPINPANIGSSLQYIKD